MDKEPEELLFNEMDPIENEEDYFRNLGVYYSAQLESLDDPSQCQFRESPDPVFVEFAQRLRRKQESIVLRDLEVSPGDSLERSMNIDDSVFLRHSEEMVDLSRRRRQPSLGGGYRGDLEFRVCSPIDRNKSNDSAFKFELSCDSPNNFDFNGDDILQAIGSLDDGNEEGPRINETNTVSRHEDESAKKEECGVKEEEVLRPQILTGAVEKVPVKKSLPLPIGSRPPPELPTSLFLDQVDFSRPPNYANLLDRVVGSDFYCRPNVPSHPPPDFPRPPNFYPHPPSSPPPHGLFQHPEMDLNTRPPRHHHHIGRMNYNYPPFPFGSKPPPPATLPHNGQTGLLSTPPYILETPPNIVPNPVKQEGGRNNRKNPPGAVKENTLKDCRNGKESSSEGSAEKEPKNTQKKIENAKPSGGRNDVDSSSSTTAFSVVEDSPSSNARPDDGDSPALSNESKSSPPPPQHPPRRHNNPRHFKMQNNFDPYFVPFHPPNFYPNFPHPFYQPPPFGPRYGPPLHNYRHYGPPNNYNKRRSNKNGRAAPPAATVEQPKPEKGEEAASSDNEAPPKDLAEGENRSI